MTATDFNPWTLEKSKSLWRREALARFPEMRRKIADAEGLNLFWFEISCNLFEPAYASEPPDAAIIARVFGYAYWCLTHRSIEVRTAVVVSFYEHLMWESKTWQDLPCWISQDDFDMLGFAWEYATKEKFADLRQEFIANKARIEKEKRTKRNL